MSESKREKVERLAEQTAEQAGRRWTITKFGRHEDGYFHARVTIPGGRPVYVDCKFGSWQAPGLYRGNAVRKEVVKEVAVELVKRQRAVEKAEREQAKAKREAEENEPDHDASSDADADGQDADGDVRSEGSAESAGQTDAPEGV